MADGDEVESAARRLRRLQERVSRRLSGPQFSVDEFLAERRREAEREEESAKPWSDPRRR